MVNEKNLVVDSIESYTSPQIIAEETSDSATLQCDLGGMWNS